MKISNIRFHNNIQILPKALNSSFRGLNNDVFIKSANNRRNKNDTDYGQSYNSFIQWLEDKYTYLKEINFKGKLIGSGFEGVVYEINGTDNWVMKESKRSSLIPYPVSKMEILEIPDDFPSLNIGQPIAKVTMPKNSVFSYTFYVLKRQKGQSLGVAPDELNINDFTVNKHLNSLKLLASAPQSTYDKLINDVVKISQNGYEIDCGNSNNFMFDSDNQSVNFVDVNKYEKDVKKTNQLGNVLYSLLDTSFESLMRDSKECNNTLEQRKYLISQICEKYFRAMKANGLMFNLDFLFINLLNTSILNDILSGDTELKKVEILIKLGLM